MLKLLILFVLAGCSGYRLSQQENPLSQYGIQSLAIPVFYNYSNVSEVSTEFTRETYRLLTGFSGLKLINGYSSSADAVLIGIVKSPEKIAETFKPRTPRLAQSKAESSIGSQRQKFYIPATTEADLHLQIIVIKKPTEEDLVLLRSSMGTQVTTNSKIIFNEMIPVRMTYTREVLDDKGTQVVATQNFGVQRKIVKTMAEQAANSVRDLILYAF